MKDFGIAFKYDCRTNPSNREIGDSAVVPIISGALVVVLIAGMFLFRHVLGNSEPFLDHYSYRAGATQSIEIHQGCYVFIAPITTEDAYVGSLSVDIILKDIQTYDPVYKSSNEAGSYIGISAEHLKQYLGEDSDFSKDKDGIVWISVARTRTLS